MNLLNIIKGKISERLLWESRENSFTVQVWEKDGLLKLRFGNKILQSVFSKIKPNHLVLEYTRLMLLSLLFCPHPKSVLHIGLGGGSLPRWLHQEFPDIQQVIIELSSGVIEAAYKFFEFPNDKRLRIINADASKIVPEMKEKFDLIFLDAFNDQGVSEEILGIDFIRNLSVCLNTSGWVVGNFWTVTGDFIEQCNQWKTTFSSVLNARANKKGNEILFGSQNSKNLEKLYFQQISKILENRYKIEFQKMNIELKQIF